MQEENRTAGESVKPLDVGDSTLMRRFSPRLKYGHKDNIAEKPRTPEILIPCRITPLNPSPSAASFTEDSIVNMFQGSGASGTSDSEKEDDEVKTEEGSELDVENVSVLKFLEQSTPEPDINEETENDNMSDQRKEMPDVYAKTRLDIDTVPENAPVACKIRSSTADDLDELMDIGTLDQVDQEAQMKGDLLDLETTCSPSSSNTGEAKY